MGKYLAMGVSRATFAPANRRISSHLRATRYLCIHRYVNIQPFSCATFAPADYTL
ncbi:hypothetical protein NEUTE2DRAFT_170651 [Neurospora tetrasperma FGSC 2509]|nr:hypothetical protein NEUTE2DRAFT_170651 [Neurospora tetrasperma FGSC 2509]